ncbi:hypothetical protein KQI89_12680 [Clostridium sp. MSJ-4]|uniref:Acetyltransferase n=1 Tax=Clostridium simiarum TaxID=2841506 RepID=A0ABS6F4T2_9CLOT|nr:hypothetical protein [Clostridium simiarum]MBU5592613.1 hypothetical protein [Clostridium simiarum]
MNKNDNLEAILNLKLAEGQDAYVASHMYSLAQAYGDLVSLEKPCIPFAIYNNEEVVGFTRMEYDMS